MDPSPLASWLCKCPARACTFLQGWLQEIPDDWSSGLPVPRYLDGVPSWHIARSCPRRQKAATSMARLAWL